MSIINNMPYMGRDIDKNFLSFDKYGAPIRALTSYEKTLTNSSSITNVFFLRNDVLAVCNSGGNITIYKLTNNISSKTISTSTLQSQGEEGASWNISCNNDYVIKVLGKTANLYSNNNGTVDFSSPVTITLSASCSFGSLSPNGEFFMAGDRSKLYIYKKTDGVFSLLKTLSDSNYSFRFGTFVRGTEATEIMYIYYRGSSGRTYMYYKTLAEDGTLTFKYSSGGGDRGILTGYALSRGILLSVYSDDRDYFATYCASESNSNFDSTENWFGRYAHMFNNLTNEVGKLDITHLDGIYDQQGNRTFVCAYDDFLKVDGTGNYHTERNSQKFFSDNFCVKLPSHGSTSLIIRGFVTPSSENYILNLKTEEGNVGLMTDNVNEEFFKQGTYKIALRNFVSDDECAEFPSTVSGYMKIASFYNPFGNFNFSCTLSYGNGATTYNGIAIYVNNSIVKQNGGSTNDTTVSWDITSKEGDLITLGIRGTQPDGVTSYTFMTNPTFTFDFKPSILMLCH